MGPGGPMYNPNAPPFIPSPHQMPPNMFMGPNGMPFPAIPPNGGPPFPQQHQQGGRGRGGYNNNNGFNNNHNNFNNQQSRRDFNGPHHRPNNRQTESVAEQDTEMGDGSTAGDVEDEKVLADTPCYFGQKCSKPECRYGHPSPAAPPGRQHVISANDKCPFGTKCKNAKVKNPTPIL